MVLHPDRLTCPWHLLLRRYTLLHIAAGVGRADMLQVLLQHQAAAALVNDADNSDSATPLHAAAMTGSAACVELLLQHEADASAAGTGQLLAWELVPTDSSSPAVQQLRKQLQEAAGVAPGAVSKVKPRVSELNPAASPSSTAGTAVSSRRDGTKSKIARAVAEGVHASADPVAAYAAQFAKLNGTEQGRKVDTFARTSGAELAQLDFLTDEARQAISQVSLGEGWTLSNNVCSKAELVWHRVSAGHSLLCLRALTCPSLQ
eukprot:GHUV01038086.1.p1 GENE.GHUV01038086.1~~GHUV01038086.1.p1  ORF type:complete len:261 (+),score=86.63 GHUV01038086.1:1010-1792(+)